MSDWTEETAAVYRNLAAVAVPARDEQIAVLLTLLPFGKDTAFRVVELASGEGFLAAAILSAFPNATLLALDGGQSMLKATAKRLGPFSGRGSVGEFDLAAPDWIPHMRGADVVVSSLCIHHLDGAQKQTLFQHVQHNLSERGVCLIADLVEASHGRARHCFADTLDHSAKHQSCALVGSDELFDLFLDEKWNYYRYPDPVDKPSTLFDQLLWLRDAGFVGVDCFWMQAGHAIFGGYKNTSCAENGLRFDDALLIARKTLGMEA